MSLKIVINEAVRSSFTHELECSDFLKGLQKNILIGFKYKHACDNLKLGFS